MKEISLRYYFYDSDWPWVKELNGLYHCREEVLEIIAQRDALLEALEGMIYHFDVGAWLADEEKECVDKANKLIKELK